MPEPNGEEADGQPVDERTPLFGNSTGNRHLLPDTIRNHRFLPSLDKQVEDGRAWVQYPARGLRTTWLTLASNYVNILLIFVPLGIIAGVAEWSPVSVFVLNFFAIIPLAGLLSFATEELSVKLGETLGGLMNATFGNAVELIVSIVALTKGEIRIVQSSMLGSMLGNMLLVLGFCFVAGGIRGGLQNFNETVASTMSSLLLVASASLIIPATLYSVMAQNGSTDRGEAEDNVMVLSRGTSIILLILYVLYLFFQLHSHAHVFNAPTPASGNPHSRPTSTADLESEANYGTEGTQPAQTDNNEEEQPDEHILGPKAAAAALLIVTLLVAVCAEYLVDSIDSIVQESGVSKTFIGLILLPIVGNAAEHVTAVVVSVKGKMDLAMGVAVGSSMQIALLVTPALVILGWIIGQPMTLHFETFETVVFFLSVLVVNCGFPALPSHAQCSRNVKLTIVQISSKTASPITSRAACCSASTSLSPSHSTSIRTTPAAMLRPRSAISSPPNNLDNDLGFVVSLRLVVSYHSLRRVEKCCWAGSKM